MAGTAGVVESGELARVAAHLRACPKYPPYWWGGNGVFLFDIAKVKEEVPDIVTWAEVMWRFPGVYSMDPRLRRNLLIAGLLFSRSC